MIWSLMDVDPYEVSFCVCFLLESAMVFQVWHFPHNAFSGSGLFFLSILV